MSTAELPTGIDLCFESFGDVDAPTILLMHGLGSQLLLWEEGFCEGLAATGFRVVRYDHRDSGLSTMLDDGVSYTLSDMADDAVGLLDHLGVERAHIVGFSLGGMIAQTFAIEHPDRAHSLVSMGSNTGNPDLEDPPVRCWPPWWHPLPTRPTSVPPRTSPTVASGRAPNGTMTTTPWQRSPGTPPVPSSHPVPSTASSQPAQATVRRHLAR